MRSYFIDLARIFVILLLGFSISATAQTTGGAVALTLTLSSAGASIESPTDLEDQTIESALSQGLISMEEPAESAAKLIDTQSVSGARTQLRHIQLSTDQIVVTLSDINGNEIYKATQVDPRLLRAEILDEDGKLEYREFYLSSASLNVVIPRIPGAQNLQLLKPKWDGQAFSLKSLSQIDISDL